MYKRQVMRLEDKEDKMKEKNIKSVSVFLISQIISLFGSSIVSYAIVWYITMKTSSTVALAVSIAVSYTHLVVHYRQSE